MSITLGYKGRIEVSFDGAATYEKLALVKEGKYKPESSEIDTTTWDDEGSTSSKPGLITRTLSVQGYFDGDDSVHRRLLDRVEDKETVYIKYYSNKSTGRYIEGRATINSFELSNTIEDPVGFSMDLTFSGRVQRVTA